VEAPPPEATATCTDEEKGVREDWTESYAPDPALPLGSPPASSPVLDRVRSNGMIVVGVDENTGGFAVRNDDAELEGLEIELVRAIARRIWPDATRIDDHIRYVAVVTDQKVPFVRDGLVDLTASVITINCDRWKEVAFSTSYFTTPQRVMVRSDSDIASIDDIAGRRVCATSRSSTVQLILDKGGIPVEREARTDCLVALQEGDVDAIASHDTILHGLRKQDPRTTVILPDAFEDPSNYGIAMPSDDVAFVRFVNGVLQDMRDRDELAGLYRRWLEEIDYRPVPKVPDPAYRSES
jgi:polar amino acid transport system substrate-binding protein